MAMRVKMYPERLKYLKQKVLNNISHILMERDDALELIQLAQDIDAEDITEQQISAHAKENISIRLDRAHQMLLMFPDSYVEKLTLRDIISLAEMLEREELRLEKKG